MLTPRFWRILAFAAAVQLLTASADAAGWRWIVSTDSQRFLERPELAPREMPAPIPVEPTIAPTTEPNQPPELEPQPPLVIVIDPTATAQQIDGWGGCFNEIGWRALLRLDELDRQQVLRSLFDEKDGLGFNIARTPIGASDFALSAYSLDDVSGDLDLKHFSIDRDRYMLIPYIKAALAIRPDLKLWASPWSPPAWMKTSGTYRSGSMKQEPAIFRAYATYLARYVEDYKAEGITISAVHPQNEPGISSKYPTCVWKDPATMRDFIRDYLIPTWAERKVPAQLWFGTITNGDFDWFKTVLEDEKIRSVIGGVGIQYEGRKVAAKLHAAYPELPLWQTETRCYNGNNSWAEAEDTFASMQTFFRGGVSAYMYWNMVLDKTGQSSWGWPQDSTIVIDTFDASVTYTPQYHLMKHLSAFVKPGAHFLKPTVQADPLLTYKTADGSVIAVVSNTSRFVRSLELHVGNQTVTAELPAHSFSTFVCQ